MNTADRTLLCQYSIRSRQLDLTILMPAPSVTGITQRLGSEQMFHAKLSGDVTVLYPLLYPQCRIRLLSQLDTTGGPRVSLFFSPRARAEVVAVAKFNISVL